MSKESVLFYAVGDVVPHRENPESLFELVAPIIRKADIAFCQLETPLSDRKTTPQVHSYSATPFCAPAKNVKGLTFAGFNIVSAAGNHILDSGEEPLFDTLEILKENKIAVCGVGANIKEARKPVILKQKGTSVAFLGYNCVLPHGQEADVNKPGSNPIWVDTFYKQVDAQPGTPPVIITIPAEQDVKNMRDDIRAAKSVADLVVISIHWGVHLIPGLIAMYQTQVGHEAIDAGADIILGHHAHIIKGIEVYKGKAIFYSMGNFVFDHNRKPNINREQKARGALYANIKRLTEEEYPTYPFPLMSTRTMIVKCLISDGKINKVSFLPAVINKKGQPGVLGQENEVSREIFNMIQETSSNFGTKFSWDQDEIVVST